MKIGIMQPYYFPYIGYWQLMNAVDKYVIYDDVNFIKGGWINRNRILNNGEPMFFNVKMQNSSPNLLINEIEVSDDEIYKNKQIKTLEMLYKKSPYFTEIMPVISEIIMFKEKNLALYLANSIMKIASFLEMKTEFIISSTISKDNNLKGQAKVLEICKKLNATEYFNAIGGQELYNYDDFLEKDIILHFLKTERIEYEQFNKGFIESLSIIDVLMFNGKEKTKNLFDKYIIT